MSHNNGNGRGLAMADGMAAEKAERLLQLPPAMQRVKDAIVESITPDDLKMIMAKQVEKARSGDVRAAAFVLSVANKMTETKGVSIVQNNYYEARANRPDKPMKALSSAERAEIMRRRMESGEDLHRPGDSGRDDPEADLS